MGYRYIAYGLFIGSDIELPELGDELGPGGDLDLTIRLAEVPRFETDGGGPRNSAHWIDPTHFWLHVDGVAHYLVCDGCDIKVMIEPNADPIAVRLFLLGSVCGAMLLQRGKLVLHGNAIRVDGACIVCVGDSGAGKSTLAAGFLRRGFQVLADDVIAVDDEGRATPGFPRIKLWQDAADQLGFSTEGMAQVYPGMEKYSIPLFHNAPPEPLPIHWIYLITADDVSDIKFTRVSGIERFSLLRNNTYRNEFLEGREMLARHLRQCSDLARVAHISKVVRPSKGFWIDKLIDMLLDDVGKLPVEPAS